MLELEDWVAKNLNGKAVGCDPNLMQATRSNRWVESWAEKGIELVPLSENLVDIVWGGQQPARPCSPIAVHPTELAGCTVSQKLTLVREELAKEQVGILLINALDQVAWLMNLRGSDIECNPVFFSYAVVTSCSAFLYIQLLDAVEDHASTIHVSHVC